MPHRQRIPLRGFDGVASRRRLDGKLAALAGRIVAQSGAAVTHASLGDFDVPTYDGDIEQTEALPQGAEALRQRLIESDAFIIASPEYNASMPGGLKT